MRREREKARERARLLFTMRSGMGDSLFGGLPAPSSTSSACEAAATVAVAAVLPKKQEAHAPAGTSILKPSIKRSSSGTEDEESKRVRFKTTVDATEEQILGAMQKIGAHIGNPAKFSKASKLALQLLDAGSVTKDTADHFFDVLKAAMLQPDRATEQTLRADYLALFDAVQEKLDCFSQVHQGQIEVWLLWAKVANDLYTDDTFVFSKAAGRVRQAISSLSEPVVKENTITDNEMATADKSQDQIAESICSSANNVSGVDALESDPFGLNALLLRKSKKDERARKRREEEAAIKRAQQEIDNLATEQREALLECLKIAADRYKHPWAQTIIDMTVKYAFDNITRFSAPQREAIEKLWVSVREQQFRRKQGKSSSGKLDVTAFERLQHMYAGEKISIRRAVGSGGDRTAEQWLG
ncbi:hypothetical protein O6H91_09G032200 [Diphasiastrum complanatum]|uniref:Uncharacterized protein n=2 Tax=Diphasiastrum complanatum TaxID=34168 RepID=A0ACC2CMT9_DIPCM|nr:hypothetical protein O6H91_09G032200 [Diphasiastrum complanatum]